MATAATLLTDDADAEADRFIHMLEAPPATPLPSHQKALARLAFKHGYASGAAKINNIWGEHRLNSPWRKLW